MALNKEQKEQLVKKMAEQMKTAKSVVFADYKGLTVADLHKIRMEMREAGVKFQVAKKTLMRIAAKEAGFADVSREMMEGPVGAAFSMEDEIVAAKILHKFSKTNKNLQLRSALFEGKVLSAKDTLALATLPSKEELLVKFLYLLKSPIQGFHGVLQNTISGFVRALNAIKDKQAA